MAKSRLKLATDPSRLRWLLGALFLGLAIPAAVLIRQGFSQIELEAFRGQQLIAEEFSARIDRGLAAALRVEDTRPFTDYEFAVGDTVGANNVLQRSPLSASPNAGTVPGTLGYFQVDAGGQLTTPLLPVGQLEPISFGIAPTEQAERQAIETKVLDVLAVNRLVRTREQASAPAVRTESAPAALSADGAEAIAENSPQVESRLRESLSSATDAVGIGPRASGAPVLEETAVAAARPVRAVEEVRGQAAFDQLAGTTSNASTAQPEASLGRGDAPALEAAPETPGRRVATGEAEADSTLADVSDGAAVEVSVFATQKADDAVPGESLAGVEPTSTAPGAPMDADSRGAEIRVATFQKTLEPLRFSQLDTGHFVLFRNAYRDGQRLVQGLLLDQRAFLDDTIAESFMSAGLAPGTGLVVRAGADEVLQLSLPRTRAVTRAASIDGRVIHSARLSPPLADIEMAFTAGELPVGPAYRVLVWTGVVLFSVLVGGFLAMYRFGLQQIKLARQQQNFVSAVSHELKTPLTSIRMYGEMLKSGWASEEKKQTYYDFIFAEGERLSRLIDNVLQLARLNRGGAAVVLEPLTINAIIDMVRSKVTTQAESAKVKLTLDIADSVKAASVLVDADALAQVFINLVDNAIKFGGDASRREIVLSARMLDSGRVVFAVRDFGPGIPPADMKRLFELFYRPDNELTRTTAGTGIGLALVQQLVAAMHGRVDLRNCDPGAEFRLVFPLVTNELAQPI